MPTPDLTETERKVLAIEKRFWLYEGLKANEIRDQLDISATRYYMELNRMIDDPRVIQAEPVLCHRLQRIRDGWKR